MVDLKDIFVIGIEDVQCCAMRRVGRKLTCEELFDVKSMVEFGLECWEDVVFTAIDEVTKQDSPV
ncbi:hypothetical protein KKB18_01670 [bacterium]|nr:hypothetical protein [bacterium]